jgi:uncharacterized protein (DUF1330 family)
MTATPAKGYWMVHLTLHDGRAFMAYLRAARKIFKEWNATYLVQAGQAVTREGEAREKHVVVMFESYDVAMACYESPAYQDAIKLREGCADMTVVIAEGAS